jgi:hypothetical protein
MRALLTLIIAGATAALLSAPAGAVEPVKTDLKTAFSAQQATACQGWGVRCEIDVTPSYCLAEDKCATALPGSALIRYDQRMDTILRP